MIRCYPVDGSEPFEVDNDDVFEHIDFDGDSSLCTADDIADRWHHVAWLPVLSEYPKTKCRIESWRERAERLEDQLNLANANLEFNLAHDVYNSALKSENDPELDAKRAAYYAAEKRFWELRSKTQT